MEQRTGAGKTQAEPSRKEKPAAAPRRADAPELPLQELQHAAGNRAVGRLLRSSMGGREGGGGGGDEQPSGSAPLRRLGTPAPEGGFRSGRDDPARPSGAGLVQLKAAHGAPAGGARADDAQAARRALSRGAGQPLDNPTRDFFERSFGYDFSPVRVHHDSQAAESADSLGALAYTYGHQIVFRNGQYAPGTREGRRLLGHELAHVVQQSGGEGFVQGAGLTRDAYEAEADAASARALAGLSVGPLARVGSSLVQKADPPGAAPAPAAAAPPAVKPPQPGVETPPPGKPYLKGKYSGHYVYVYNSEEALTSADIWEVVVFNHLTRVFPGISRGLTKWALEEMRKINNTITGDWRKTANEYSAVGFSVMADFHKNLVELVQSKQPDALPSEPQEGADGSGDGGGAAPAPEPEGGEVDAAAAPPPEAVKGTKIHFPADISQEEKERLLKLIEEFLGAPDPSKAGSAPPDIYVTKRLRALLEEMDKSPHRARILEMIRAGDGKQLDRHVEDALETAIADAKIEAAQKDFKLPAGTGERNTPERKRPVRGGIRNLSDELVPNKQAKFMAEFTHEVSAFRIPVVNIQWVAHEAGDPAKEVYRDVTSYIGGPPRGSIDHRVFNVTFTKPGNYRVVALVHHNFYEPNVFELNVEVVSEKELSERLNKEALAGFTENAQPSSSHWFYVGGVTGFQQGTVTRGDLDPKTEILTIEARLKAATDKEAELTKLIETYKAVGTSDARAVVSWAEDYLETLKESRGPLEAAQKEGAVPLGVRGSFASRTPEAPSKVLNLLCYFTKEEGDDEYTVYLHDFTQLAEPTDYFFSARARTVGQGQEEVFADQASAYPVGTLSVTFQAYDEVHQSPGGWYVKYDMNTETFGKKVKAAVFDPYVDIAVNLATAVMMVVPGLQGVAVAVAIVYNTARTVSEMEELANKGMLSTEKASIKGLEIGLNLIPLAGKGFKVMTIAGKSFYAIESVTYLGNALLVTTQAMSQIEALRNGIIMEIAEIEGQIQTIEGMNKADPRLRELRKKRDELVEKGKTEARNVIVGIAAEQGLQMIGQHLISGYMARKFSIGQLKSQGAFRHDKNVQTPYYDFKERVIVGDELRVTPSELERLQFQHGQSSALESHVPHPSTRKDVVDALGDRPVEVRKGEKTSLRHEGDKAILEVAEGATPDDILAAVRGSTPPAAPAATPPAAPAATPPDTGAAAPAAKPPAPAQDKPPAPSPKQEQPAAPPPSDAKDLSKSAGGPEQAKDVAESIAEPAPAPAAEPAGAAPGATPPAQQGGGVQPAPDGPDVTPAKKDAQTPEQPAEARPAPEDDFKPVELQEPTKPAQKPDAPEAAGDKSAGGQPVAVKEGSQSGGETPGAKPPEKRPEGAEGDAKAKPAETPAPDSPEAKAKADAEAKKAAAAKAEAEAEAAAVAEKELEDKARARFAEAKKAGYQAKMKGSKQDTVDDFIALYKSGQELGPPPSHRWRSSNPVRVRKPAIVVTKDTTSAEILEHLKGPKSKSTFKKFYETITGKKFATPEEVTDALEQVRKELDIANKPSNMDDVRHALKGKFKGRMLDSMFEGPGGKKLTPAESHAKMRELTEGLDSADKGPMTEEWQQRTRLAAGAQNTAEQVQVNQGDHPDVKLEKDRQLDRLEGIPTKTVKDGVETSELKNDVQINEVKSGEGALGQYDYGELRDHLKLATGDGVTIDVRGTKRTVKEVRWTFTSSEGAKANADFLKDMLKANGDIFSVEVYNSAGKRGVFTGADIAKDEWALHDFLGNPRPKTTTPPATTTPPTPPTPTPTPTP